MLQWFALNLIYLQFDWLRLFETNSSQMSNFAAEYINPSLLHPK